eukprot:6194569-Pleurochrysis_carterae.AAC.3
MDTGASNDDCDGKSRMVADSMLGDRNQLRNRRYFLDKCEDFETRYAEHTSAQEMKLQQLLSIAGSRAQNAKESQKIHKLHLCNVDLRCPQRLPTRASRSLRAYGKRGFVLFAFGRWLFFER